ncbi:SDR family oxidoreductase [Fodinicurvata sp. EGI_FJ10296]|uniref:SDR family oxidoreductase n=1 Tax=Fodinicurvata sp. EGI_FJ10296 TaxID=3231908 RepID=UPI0034524AA2
MPDGKLAVVLGAYGLIGAACLRALKADGFTVVGVGRSMKAGAATDSGIRWLCRDIAATPATVWATDLAGADVVVNASGALQDGARDNLTGIHETAISQLLAALSGTGTRFIQISAAGVSENASTAFFRSKMRGDRLVMASDLDWVILRPTLVIGPQAYGGTALLRGGAALPLVTINIHPNAPIQTVAVDDVAQAVVQAARGDIAGGTVADLTEPDASTLADVTARLRRWQGFPPRRFSITIPESLMRVVGSAADALGWLGWRSPLRTTALRTLKDGITGDPSAWLAAGGQPCKPLDRTLVDMPATVQERWFARLYLLMPVMVATLALFWLASGLIGIWSREAAQAVLTDRDFSGAIAAVAIGAGILADIGLGLAILYRPWARIACLGMIAASIAYLAGATIWTADLWADPLGPLVKILPGIVLSMILAALLDER